MKKDRDEWKSIALRNLAIGEQAVNHAASLQSGSPEKRLA